MIGACFFMTANEIRDLMRMGTPIQHTFDIPHGEESLQGYFPVGFYPRKITVGDFFLQGIHPKRKLSNGKVFFLHLYTIISYMVWIQFGYCMMY